MLPICKSYAQYEQALLYAEYTWTIMKKLDFSSRMVATLASSTFGIVNLAGLPGYFLDEFASLNVILLRIHFTITDFEELTNEKMFNECDLFTQVRGPIGLMLGFLFLHLPGYVKNIVNDTRFKKQRTKLTKFFNPRPLQNFLLNMREYWNR